MNFIRTLFGIFIPININADDIDEDFELEETIKVYSGNALDGGDVEEEKAYKRYSVS